jgi:hypothetical protein
MGRREKQVARPDRRYFLSDTVASRTRCYEVKLVALVKARA